MKAQPKKAMKAMKRKAKCQEEEAEISRNRSVGELLSHLRWQALRELARAL
jgi:hypothetical protein